MIFCGDRIGADAWQQKHVWRRRRSRRQGRQDTPRRPKKQLRALFTTSPPVTTPKRKQLF